MNVWERVNEIETAKECILSGYTKHKWFNPDPLLDKVDLPSARCVLEIGCGIGRNLTAIIDRATQATVYGYDYPNMIEMAKAHMGEDKWGRVRFVNPPCSNLASLKCDLIIETLVFQHIPEQELRELLAVLAGVLSAGGTMLTFGRGYLDDGRKNKWKIMLDYFTPTQEFKLNPENGTDDHQYCVMVPK